MKRIVRGNDFIMQIPVVKIEDGEEVAFPLPACTEIEVSLVNKYKKKYPLPFTIDVENTNVLLATVKDGNIPLGKYAIEVKGLLFGNAWRSKEYNQIRLIDHNAAGNTELADLASGECSILMDTAVAIVSPSTEVKMFLEALKSLTTEQINKITNIENNIE